jgi:hypothetical protein
VIVIRSFLVAVFLVSAVLAAGQSDPIPLEMDIENHVIYVTLQINGRDALFIVDTGAGISIIDPKQADAYRFKWHPEKGAGKLHTVGGRSEFNLTSRIIVSYRDIELKHLRFYASNIDALQEFFAKKDKEIIGIVGSDFLQQYHAVIDYGENKIYLQSN